jgi:hypothetical protein
MSTINGQASESCGPTRRCSRPLRARDRWYFERPYPARSRQLNGKPLGGWGSVVGTPFLVPCAGLGCARRLCQGRRAGARCAGVVRPPVVRNARCAQPDRVLGVVLMEARGAGVIACRCGTRMPGAGEPAWPAHPTRPCSRPLRARDRLLFDTLCVARLRRLMGKPLGGSRCHLLPPIDALAVVLQFRKQNLALVNASPHTGSTL